MINLSDSLSYRDRLRIKMLWDNIYFTNVKFKLVDGKYTVLNCNGNFLACVEGKGNDRHVNIDGYSIYGEDGERACRLIITKCLAENKLEVSNIKSGNPFRNIVSRLTFGYHRHSNKPVAYYANYSR